MDNTSKPFTVMTIDGLHYVKSVIVSDNPYELTILGNVVPMRTRTDLLGDTSLKERISVK